MKIYPLPLIAGGLITIVIFQGILFVNTSLESQKLQKQVDDLSEKLQNLQATIADEVLASLVKIRQESTLLVAEGENQKETTDLFLADSADLLSEANLSKTLGAQTTTPQPTNLSSTQTNKVVRLKSNWNKVDVFETTKTSSRIVGQISLGKDYQVVEKRPDWYLIRFDLQTNAWVQALFVYETN